MSIINVILLPVLLLALAVHEFAHAYVAYKLGDSSPKIAGRVTLNPLAHLDFFGTSLLIITLLSGGPAFGWGKPVMVNIYNFKNPKKDYGLVAFAGPASNILMAALGLSILLIFKDPIIVLFLSIFILTNFSLALFNLLPIYPLDGFNVLSSLLPHNLSMQFQETQKYGMIVLIVLLFTGGVGKLFTPFFAVIYTLIQLVVSL